MIELPQCEYRGTIKRKPGCGECWVDKPHECEYLETNIIPIEHCTECKLMPPPLSVAHKNEIENLRLVMRQSEPNPDYVVGEGRGIVTVGGGKYWPGIYVMIRLLREMGCALPVEVWYRSRWEDVHPEHLNDPLTVFRDVDEIRQKQGYDFKNGHLKSDGFAAKLDSIYYSRFREIAFIDADAYFVADPAPLLDMLDGRGFVYWQDLPQQMNAVKWEKAYPEGKGTQIAPIQGGQIFLDKLQTWKLVHASKHMCDRREYFFKCMFGDQDTWRVGLTAGLSTHLNLGAAPWLAGKAFVCSHNGIPYVVHRCQSKLFAPHDIPKGKVKYSNPEYSFPRETQVFDLLAECLRKRTTEAKDVFGMIYARQVWGKGSGAGSTLREGQPYIDRVNQFIQRNQIQSIVDIGSGDGVIASQLKVPRYIGLDCADQMIAKCRSLYTGAGREFHDVDCFKDVDKIPSADVLLCKDVLHHWPTAWVVSWLERIIAAGRWKTILLCQDNAQKSPEQDCHVGGYRALNYTMKPLARFNLVKECDVRHKHLLRKDLTNV
jgi:hypothetical protein